MKNKNSIFIFVIVTMLFSLAKVFFIKDFKVPREPIIVSTTKSLAIPQADLRKIEGFLKPKNIQSPSWKVLVDYRVDLNTIITKDNAKDYFETALNNLPDLVECLRKDYCGMDKASISAPYFDNERTPAHLLVARTLNVLQASLKQVPELAIQIDWNLITEISGLNGNEVKAASMELLISFDKRNNGKEHLFEIAEGYKGIAKAKFYSEMAADLAAEERPVFINTLEKTLESDDADTIISTVEKMNTFRLTHNEIARVGKALCRFKRDESQEHNWKMIVMNMKKMDNNFEQHCL